MSPSPIHELPPGYAEITYVLLTEDQLLLRLNLLAAVPVVLMVAFMALWWAVVSQGRASDPSIPVPWWLALFVIIVVVLPLHELIHGIVIRARGQHVRYGAKLSKGVLYATADEALFRRNEYVAVALAPLVTITLLVMVLMALLPQGWAYYAGIAAVLNAGGAVGDLWTVSIVLRYPPQALVRDEADGFRIYAPGAASGSSIQNTEPPSAG